MKFGAYVSCAACGQRPKTELDAIYSLVLTDHYFSMNDLTLISESMLTGGPRPSLPQHQEEMFRPQARQYLEMFGPLLSSSELDEEKDH